MLIGELMADSGYMPDDWTPGTMSMVQLCWLSYWRIKKERKQLRGLGELLGVIWTSETYRKSPVSQTHKRVKEAFIPLAALINGESLYKTLDKILDTSPTAGANNPAQQDLGSMLSMQAYQKLFQDNKQQTESGGPLIPGHPLLSKTAHVPGAPTTPVTSPATRAQPSVPATPNTAAVDLEKLRAIDPELARHMDPDAAW